MCDYQLSVHAHVKILLHAASHPACTCHGLLLAESVPSKSIRIVDAIPLFHHDLPLAPITEVACATVDAYCQQQSQRIIGYFQAKSIASLNGKAPVLTHYGERMAEKILSACPEACILLVDEQKLDDEKELGLHLLLQDGKKGWTLKNSQLSAALRSLESRKEFEKSFAHMIQDSDVQIYDFDDHLDDISKDWRNPNLGAFIRLHV